MRLPEKESDLVEQGYIRILEHDGRDIEQKLLRGATSVLCHPLAPEEFLEDSPANRSKFLALDCAWTEKVRQRIWFPETPSLSRSLQEQIDWNRSAKERFFAAVQGNVMASLSSPLPAVHASKWINLLPFEWEPKIKHVEQVDELTNRFFAALRPQSGVRTDLTWPLEWEALVKEMNTVLVYDLAGFRSRVHVVIGFATRFCIRRQEEPQFIPLDQAHVNTVQEVYRLWLAEQAGPRPQFAFFTIGTAGALPANLTGITASDYWLMLSSLVDTVKWEVRVPSPFSYRLSLRDFLDRLKPETRDQRISRIKDCVDGLFIDGGNVTVDRVKRDSGHRRSNVRDAFFELQKQAPETYRVWTKDGNLAIRKAREGEPIRITPATVGPRLLRRHGLRIGSMAVGASVSVLGSMYQNWLGVSGLTGFMVAIPILYVGNCLQATLNRRADKVQE